MLKLIKKRRKFNREPDKFLFAKQIKRMPRRRKHTDCYIDNLERLALVEWLYLVIDGYMDLFLVHHNVANSRLCTSFKRRILNAGC